MRRTVKSSNKSQLIPVPNRKCFIVCVWVDWCVCVCFIVFSVLFCCRDSCQKGWRLLYILTAFYRCSEVLKPFLLKFLRDVCKSPEVLFHGAYTLTLTHTIYFSCLNWLYHEYKGKKILNVV